MSWDFNGMGPWLDLVGIPKISDWEPWAHAHTSGSGTSDWWFITTLDFWRMQIHYLVPKIAGYPTWLVDQQPATLYIIVAYFIIVWSIEFTADFDIL